MTQKSYCDVKNECETHGLKLLVAEQEYNGLNNKYPLMCSNNHIWSPRLNTILSKNRINRLSKGCPECAENIRLNASNEIAVKKLLPEHIIIETYIKQTTQSDNRKVRFYIMKCPYDHTYHKMTAEISHGCPECSKKTFVGQERTRMMFEAQFNHLFPTVRPDWLKNPSTGRNLELDGYCLELGIAFEYQGRQHSSNDTEFGGDYEQQLERDQYKIEACAAHNIKLIEIMQPRSYESDKFFHSIAKQCYKQGLTLTIKSEDLNFHNINYTNSLVKNYEVFNDFVGSKGYTLVSPSFSTMEDTIDFMCKDNHTFSMKGATFKTMLNTDKYRNEPCIECHNKANTQLPAPVTRKSSLGLNECNDLAAKINYQCLSSSYVNIHSPLTWQCNHGHIFDKSYRQMTRNQTGQYCNECTQLGLSHPESIYKELVTNEKTNKVSKTLNGEIRDINWLKGFIQKNHLKLIGDSYLGMDIKHSFECDKGHNFESTISNLTDKLNRKTSLCNHSDCNGINVITLDTCQDFAKNNGLECLSLEYKNVNEKMDWKCSHGHNFEKSYRQFLRMKTDKYCPLCS